MNGSLIAALIAFVCLLVGGSGIETAILTGKDLFTKIAMSVLFTPFVLLGLGIGALAVISLRDYANGADKATKKVLEQDEKTQTLPPFRAFLVDFREHYASFFRSARVEENEAIQHEATQIYRTLLGLRRKRLEKLGITLETTVKSMRYDRADGLSMRTFSDGKYDITEVEEEIAATTAYRQGSKILHTRTDKDLACYTLVHAEQVGGDRILCPNCGAEATRDALLDGCDHCGTAFLVEDLEQRVTAFAFRPDYKAAKARYEMRRNSILLKTGVGLAAALLLCILVYLTFSAPAIMEETGLGIITVTMSVLFGSVISAGAVLFILAFLFPMTIPAIGGLIGGINLMSKTILKKLTESRKNDMSFGEYIRKYDPHFSMANFYSGLQNKISAVIYANRPSEAEAFAAADLSELAGRYDTVMDVETEYMGVTDYRMEDTLQHISVEAALALTEFDGKKVRRRSEYWQLRLIKAADCTTQVLRAPVVTRCQKCGASLDLLAGKTCRYCGNVLDMKQHDWVIAEVRRVDAL